MDNKEEAYLKKLKKIKTGIYADIAGTKTISLRKALFNLQRLKKG